MEDGINSYKMDGYVSSLTFTNACEYSQKLMILYFTAFSLPTAT